MLFSTHTLFISNDVQIQACRGAITLENQRFLKRTSIVKFNFNYSSLDSSCTDFQFRNFNNSWFWQPLIRFKNSSDSPAHQKCSCLSLPDFGIFSTCYFSLKCLINFDTLHLDKSNCLENAIVYFSSKVIYDHFLYLLTHYFSFWHIYFWE